MLHVEHPNHRPITLFRAGSFLTRAQGKEIQDYFEDSKQGVGSYWEGGHSNKVATGLSFDEQDLLLPYIINCQAKDNMFREKVDLYFHEMDTKVPHNKGTVLETGLKLDNNKPLSDKNMPLDITDFIKWRHAKGHPHVARNKKESDSNPLKQFYIFDREEINHDNKKLSDQKDSAMQLYLTLKKEPEKINMVLTLLGKDVRAYSGPTEMDDKLAELRRQSEEHPDTFSDACKKEDLNIRYTILNMVNVGVLTKIGEKLIDTEAQKIIGNNLEEAIIYFNDPENSGAVVMLKSRMQEAGKKPFVPPIRRTVVK